jgi:hypothetical protein
MVLHLEGMQINLLLQDGLTEDHHLIKNSYAVAVCISTNIVVVNLVLLVALIAEPTEMSSASTLHVITPAVLLDMS